MAGPNVYRWAIEDGELYALEWSDIDLENKLITVSKSHNHRMKTVKSTKAGCWRKVPINQELEAMLVDLRLKAEPGATQDETTFKMSVIA